MELITTEFIQTYASALFGRTEFTELEPSISDGERLRKFLELTLQEEKYDSFRISRAGTTFFISGYTSAGAEVYRLKIECDECDYDELERMLDEIFLIVHV